MCVAMATVVPMDYPPPLKQGTSFLMLLLKRDVRESSVCSLCSHTRQTRNVPEILLFKVFVVTLYVNITMLTSERH